ncbi:acylphosphatase-2 isoform 1-T1 [Molossus nigricans]
MGPLLLAAVAAAPRASLRLLGSGLATMSTAGPLKSVDYEVFGRVQGVCFRMYTEGEAKKIGVVGWVKNTSKGTVTGQVQGPEEKVNSMSSGREGGRGRKRERNIDVRETHQLVASRMTLTGLGVETTTEEVLAEQGWKS